MYKRNRIWHRLRPAMIGLAIVVLVAVPSLAAFASYSGDDPYDPAAGGQPEPSMAPAETCIGPDPYDPASGCHPERSLMNQAPSEQGIVHDLFARLDAGLVDAAATEFADTAVVDDKLDGKAYLGAAQIAAMLQSWRREGRYYNVLRESTVPVADGVDIVLREVEISDSGLVRGQGAIIAVLYGGQIQTLTVTDLRLPAQSVHP
jgi:hypothetical protein